jgi:uncharacterized damage-inducible protein DinB
VSRRGAVALTSLDEGVRDQLRRMLAWEEAHSGLESVVEGIPSRMRGVVPQGLPYSAWQLLEHIRLAQHDILDFCRNPNYTELHWPDDYWPRNPDPPNAEAWDASLAAFRRDREALQQLAIDSSIDLLAPIPHGTGQTILRELLLVADHTSYHIGQLVVLRRALGIWTAGK